MHGHAYKAAPETSFSGFPRMPFACVAGGLLPLPVQFQHPGVTVALSSRAFFPDICACLSCSRCTLRLRCGGRSTAALGSSEASITPPASCCLSWSSCACPSLTTPVCPSHPVSFGFFHATSCQCPLSLFAFYILGQAPSSPIRLSITSGFWSTCLLQG